MDGVNNFVYQSTVSFLRSLVIGRGCRLKLGDFLCYPNLTRLARIFAGLLRDTVVLSSALSGMDATASRLRYKLNQYVT